MTALVFIALMAFSVVLAFMAKRGVIADSMDDVMVAGRSFGAFMVFFVTVGETYGIGTMIGVPGAIYSKGVSYSLWFLGYILLGFVVGYFMNPAIWRMGKISGAMTMPDCFRWRYGSKALEVLVAVICIVFLLPWMQMQFAGLATICATSAGTSATPWASGSPRRSPTSISQWRASAPRHGSAS